MKTAVLDWSTVSPIVARAHKLPAGARFYKCALQVNPFAYIRRHGKKTQFADESEFNKAMVSSCLANDIEVVAITDHHSVKTSESLRSAMRKAGIIVFPGFEAITKEGVHVLCLFDPATSVDRLERYLGDCGIHGDAYDGKPTKYDVEQFLRESSKWGGISIAPHVTASGGGLLKELDGQSRAAAWREPLLLACSIPGPLSDVPENFRHIIANEDPEYRRDQPVAILNAKDINEPQEFQDPLASCWIKMSSVSIDGFKQAFLDSQSRVRLASDPKPEEHAELVAIGWEGGFLDGCAIHFNENLNILVGGRGTGKSTVVESLRYALGIDPVGDDAMKLHDGIVRQVLRSGTKISLLIRTYRPSKREYLIERTIPNPPTVRDNSGQLLNLAPSDVAPRIEVYGQHEISELTKSREKLTRLLDRFVVKDANLHSRKQDLNRELERSRLRILALDKELLQIEERLAALPALEETLKAFQKAGLEERLKEQSLLVREERLLQTARERLEPVHELLERSRRLLPIDRAFLSDKAVAELPGRVVLREADLVLQNLEKSLQAIIGQLTTALEDAKEGLGQIQAKWDTRRIQVQAEYEKVLRELQKSRIDGEEFIRLRRQLEALRPLSERQALLRKERGEVFQRRRSHLAEWEDVKAARYRELEQAAASVTQRLASRVQISVAFAGNREPLSQILRERVGGRLSETTQILEHVANFSINEFVDACRSGVDALTKKFSLPPAQAQHLSQSDAETLMLIEELDLPPTTAVRLNVAVEGQPQNWQLIEDLSTGQKATAVLLLLLLESDAPLLVDQPEDDLDNRFITGGIVPKMREEKRGRQFVFATHNANIPVLGDAELIIGLRAYGEAGAGRTEIPLEYVGSIDLRSVRELIEEVLEGGKEAFEMRRLKYGF